MSLKFAVLVLLTPLTLLSQTIEEPLFPVQVNGKYGYIDRNGHIVIQPRFDVGFDFSDGVARFWVQTKKSQFTGYIDRTGKILVPPTLAYGYDFHEGLAAALAKKENEYLLGFIDKSGHWVVEPKYKWVDSFAEGLAPVADQNGLWGFIDTSGRTIIPHRYKEAGQFSNGVANVLTDSGYGFIDHSGTLVIPPRFSVWEDFSDGLAKVETGGRIRQPIHNFFGRMGWGPSQLQGGEQTYIDTAGKTVITLPKNMQETPGHFSEGLAAVHVKASWDDNSCGYIDQTGKLVIRSEYSMCGSFSNGVAVVAKFLNKKPRWAVIDKEGRTLFSVSPQVCDWVEEFHDGLAPITIWGKSASKKVGYIDLKGNVVWAPTK